MSIENPNGLHHKRRSICTYTGQEFFPFLPEHESVLLEDIAHALSQKVRFTGHCSFLYTVGQHSLLMSMWAGKLGLSKDIQKQCLLHDAAEAYLPDIASPLKSSIFIKVNDESDLVPFSAVEEVLLWTIFGRFQMNESLAPQVHELDMEIFHAEREALMPSDCGWWTQEKVRDDAPKIMEVSPGDVKGAFLERAKELGIV